MPPFVGFVVCIIFLYFPFMGQAMGFVADWCIQLIIISGLIGFVGHFPWSYLKESDLQALQAGKFSEDGFEWKALTDAIFSPKLITNILRKFT